MEIHIPNESAMQGLGAALAQASEPSCRIYLEGNLGAGKTTLVRGFLRALDYTGPVKSPTYALIEPYAFDSYSIYHLDLYRLSDPEELEYIGFRDLLDDSILLVEWPDKGEGILPDPDVSVRIQYENEGRLVNLQALTKQGEKLLSNLRFKAVAE